LPILRDAVCLYAIAPRLRATSRRHTPDDIILAPHAAFRHDAAAPPLPRRDIDADAAAADYDMSC